MIFSSYETRTESQIRHVKFAEFDLLSIAEATPSHVIRDAGGGSDRSLHGIHEQLHRHFWIVYIARNQPKPF